MAVAAGIALATTAYEIYNTEQQKSEAKRKLAALQHTNYTVSPELQSAYARAQQMSQYGYTPQEKAAHQQQQAQLLNTQSQRALDIGGGNLARTISRMGQIANLGANNQFAMQDAQLHRGNIRYADSLAQHIQQQKNLGTGEDISQFNMSNRAYGNAAMQQQQNEYQLLNNVANLASTYGGKGVNPNVTQPTGNTTTSKLPDYYSQGVGSESVDAYNYGKHFYDPSTPNPY